VIGLRYKTRSGNTAVITKENPEYVEGIITINNIELHYIWDKPNLNVIKATSGDEEDLVEQIRPEPY
jgi:hypothetical protein